MLVTGICALETGLERADVTGTSLLVVGVTKMSLVGTVALTLECGKYDSVRSSSEGVDISPLGISVEDAYISDDIFVALDDDMATDGAETAEI